MTSSSALSEIERVLLTLLGLADAEGRLTFAKTEALDFARVPGPAFERYLMQLIAEGVVIESERIDRAARRFVIATRERRPEALAYINRNRDAVGRIVAARAALEPGRGSIIGLDGIGVPAPRVVRAEPMAATKSGPRFDLTVQVAGLGTIYHCVYVAASGVVFPPSRARGASFESIIDWTSEFSEAMRAAARDFIGNMKPTADVPLPVKS